jgi:hypothetical protein
MLRSLTIFRRSCRLWQNVEKYKYDITGQATDDNTTRRMRFEPWITKARTRHTLGIFHTYCFSMATMVTRTSLNITLHVQCQYCQSQAADSIRFRALITDDNCFKPTVNTKQVRQDRQCTRKRNTEARSLDHCCRGIATIIIYSECVSVALVIQHAVPMHRVALLMTCIFLPYFSTSSHQRHNVRKKNLSNTKCVVCFSLQLLSETFLILGRIQRAIITNVSRSSRKVSLNLDRF